MSDFRQIQAAVLDLLGNLDGIPDDVRSSLRQNISAGEPEITFEAILSWIEDLEAPISAAFFQEIAEVAELLDVDLARVERLMIFVI